MALISWLEAAMQASEPLVVADVFALSVFNVVDALCFSSAAE
jgi:hypothetical protein